ncbi:MAG: lipid A deacylase LpxR family protein [Candidatus Thiodiazotropha sp.]
MNKLNKSKWKTISLLDAFGILFRPVKAVLIYSLLLFPLSTMAEFDWASVTLDNDFFIRTDDGYTNGLYVSLFETGKKTQTTPSRDFWVAPLSWSLPKAEAREAVNAYMIGQALITPSDITVENPGENEIPYSAMLALTNSYVSYEAFVADQISTTVGIIGPAAMGEEVQKLIHRLIGSDEPKGWDTQLENELVFQFSRARAWRSWVSSGNDFDLILNSEITLGTIASGIGGGAVLRYGKGLKESYVTTLFNNSRMINPSAINRGWYLYTRIQVGYLFNQIFTDGNTFRDSRSIDYEHEFIELSTGFAYSWDNYSLSFAVTDVNILQSGAEEETLENLTQYGTLTFAWRL